MSNELEAQITEEAEELDAELTRAYRKARGLQHLPEPRRTLEEEREAEERRQRRIVELRALTPATRRLQREREERVRAEREATEAVRGTVAALALGKRVSRDGAWGTREAEALAREVAGAFGVPAERTGGLRAFCEAIVGALAEGDRRRAEELAAELGRALAERGWTPSAPEADLDPRKLVEAIPRRGF